MLPGCFVKKDAKPTPAQVTATITTPAPATPAAKEGKDAPVAATPTPEAAVAVRPSRPRRPAWVKNVATLATYLASGLVHQVSGLA